MASEIRANKLTNRAGLGTVTYADTGIIVSGIVTSTGADINGALHADGFSTVGGEIAINGTVPRIGFTDSNANSDFRIKVDGGSFQIEDITNSSADRLTINSSGNVSINNDLDVNGHTNLDNVSIAGVTTFTAGAFANNVSVGGRSFQTNIDIVSTSLRGGVTVRNANDYRTDNIGHAGFQVLDPYDSSSTSFAFRAAEGATLVDNAWIKCNGTAYFSESIGIGTDDPVGEIGIWNDSPNIKLVDTNPYVAGQYGNISQSGGVLQLNAKGDGATHGSIYFYAQNNSETLNLYRTSDNTHQWYTSSDSNSIKMRLLDSGNLGIGSDSPADKFDVMGNSIFGARSTADAQVQIGRRHSGNRNAYIDIIGDDTYYDYGLRVIRKNGGENTESQIDHRGTGDFTISANEAANIRFTTNGSERLRIKSDGNVGIGTVNPLTALDIYTTPIESATINTTNSTQLGLWVRAKNPSNTTGNIYTGITLGEGRAGLYAYDAGGGAAHGMGFWTGSNSGVNERLRITNDGKVGIATASPSDGAKLEVFARGDTERGIYITDSDNTHNSPYLRVLGKRNDGNTHQSFSGRILLASLRTDAKVNSGRKVGVIMFGGNHTNTSEANILYPASIAAVAGDSYDSATDMPTDLVFYTGNTGRAPNTNNVSSGDERLRIRSGGIVELAQNVRLESKPNSTWGAGLTFGGNGNAVSSTHGSMVVTNGNLHLDSRDGSYGIYLNWYGGTTGTYFGNGSSGQRGRIDGAGNLSLSGSYPGSDLRLKENIQNISGALDTIKSLSGKTFTWKTEAGLDDWKHYGFIAQEVQKVIPDLVKDIGCHYFDKDDKLVTDIDPTESDEDRKNKGLTQSLTVNNEGVTPILVEAMKELIAKVETLESKVATLESS